VPRETSYFSRFAVKFVEIVAAGAATAVSGYLVAHLGGYLSAPPSVPAAAPAAPAAVEVAPRTGSVPKVAVTPRVEPTKPAAADNNEPRGAAQRETGPAAVAPARTTTNTAPAAPARKRATTEAAAAEGKAREKEPAEAKPREKETTESRARDKDDRESVEAQVRAALANVDASHPASAERTAPPAPPRAAEAPLTTGTIAATPRAAVVALPPQPAPLVPVQPVAPNPLISVEIKSRPVANVAGMPAPDGGQPEGVPEDVKEEKGFLATIKRIPALLRPGAAVTTSEPPRPPLPVNEP
jgi:hypothetical protein